MIDVSAGALDLRVDRVERGERRPAGVIVPAERSRPARADVALRRSRVRRKQLLQRDVPAEQGRRKGHLLHDELSSRRQAVATDTAAAIASPSYQRRGRCQSCRKRRPHTPRAGLVALAAPAQVIGERVPADAGGVNLRRRRRRRRRPTPPASSGFVGAAALERRERRDAVSVPTYLVFA